MWHVLNLFKSQHRSILGIDISSTSVKILELSKTGDQYCVEGYGRAVLPNNAMESNVIKDIDTAAACIRKVLTATGLTCKNVACAVPESSAISKVIQINAGLTAQEIEELVVVEADKYIPYPIDEINVDFSVLGPSVKNSAMLDVLIVASRSENVNNRVDVITQAGLVLKVVDVESYAIERALQLLKAELPAGGDKKNIAIFDVGAVYTHLFVLHNMKMIFSREEEFGGKQLIDLVMQHYSMEQQEALAAIEQGTLPEDYANEVLQPFKELILLQVKRSLQFFFSTSHYTFVDHIILAGGMANIPGIAQLLQEHINIPTSIANPFAHMNLAKTVDRESITKDAPMLMVACGLALRLIE
jgi:type IV pilus assembly protein PilM